ncbi:putative secreted protein with PEP-CTERM sorting signal [Kribbella antiqua]|uniref:Putative secreted protein with PEP-CTERM sorting signal n=1 Tax=Kribbella antiqua TaxID=2512217 RepID=A0A4R2IP91_9ACTN|nr:DUF1707 domain-containing protein [Kribbella antiqua]TCO47111.1 putative secreted protein with PEP-CTERM sorting signal [Kribbella antiqua]
MNDERPGGPIRIGDQEREDAVKRLGEHFEAGRLTAEEHTERIGRALEAKTEAELAALFTDLPGPQQVQANEGWGWQRPPWTAPQNAAFASGPGGPGRPDWARRGPLGRVPFPVLIVAAVIGALASIACVVGAGHPPVLPLLLIVAAVLIVRKRRQERSA